MLAFLSVYCGKSFHVRIFSCAPSSDWALALPKIIERTLHCIFERWWDLCRYEFNARGGHSRTWLSLRTTCTFYTARAFQSWVNVVKKRVGCCENFVCWMVVLSSEMWHCAGYAAHCVQSFWYNTIVLYLCSRATFPPNVPRPHCHVGCTKVLFVALDDQFSWPPHQKPSV